MWLGSFWNTDTQFRETVIRRNAEWKKFSHSCLLPWYKQGFDWTRPCAENYSVREKAKEEPSKLREGETMLIMTAYDSIINKRLVVDGCKRAVALETATNRNRTIPRVRVLECFGAQVHCIFWCDFLNLIRKTMGMCP
jgi:hypothetical protein